MANASATAQIALSVKATLNGFNITRVSQMLTIQNVKILTMELCNMAAAVESNMTGGKHGHMYIILLQPDYRIATKNNLAKVDQLQKPDNVNPKDQDREEGRPHSVQDHATQTRDKGGVSSVHHPGRSIEGDQSTDGGQHRTRVHRRTLE